MRTPLPSASLLCSWCDHAGFRADNDDVYLLSKELDGKVARLHISAYVEPLKQIVRICARVPLHLQPSTATHIVTHTRRAVCYHSQVHQHTPRSRGVGTPGVTTDYLLRDCGFAGTPAPGNGGLETPSLSTQRHRALCCTCQLPRSTLQCAGRSRRTDLSTADNGYSYSVHQVHAAWIRRLRFLGTSAQPGCTVLGPYSLLRTSLSFQRISTIFANRRIWAISQIFGFSLPVRVCRREWDLSLTTCTLVTHALLFL